METLFAIAGGIFLGMLGIVAVVCLIVAAATSRLKATITAMSTAGKCILAVACALITSLFHKKPK